MYRKTRVEKIYDDFKSAVMKEIVEGWEDEMLKEAQNSEIEFQALIKLFDEEQNLDFKMMLAGILANLRYENIQDFLYLMLNDKSSYMQFDAAMNLIRLNNSIGVDKVKELVKYRNEYDDRIPLHWILIELHDINNKLSIQCLIDLANEGADDVAKEINKKYYEEKLANLK